MGQKVEHGRARLASKHSMFRRAASRELGHGKEYGGRIRANLLRHTTYRGCGWRMHEPPWFPRGSQDRRPASQQLKLSLSAYERTLNTLDRLSKKAESASKTLHQRTWLQFSAGKIDPCFRLVDTYLGDQECS